MVGISGLTTGTTIFLIVVSAVENGMTKMTEQKSELQMAADRIRELKGTIDEFLKVEESLVKDRDSCERELANITLNLEDTRSLLRAQNEKLQRELNNMHSLCYRFEGVEASRDVNLKRNY